MTEQNKLLEIKNLTIDYTTSDGTVHAVRDLNLELGRGETLGFVGETGAGKTTTALGIMGIIPNPPGKIISGEIFYEGEDLLKKSQKEMRKVRGKKNRDDFSGPYDISRSCDHRRRPDKRNDTSARASFQKEAWERAEEMLEVVGIRRDRAKDYPHQFSGGMKQRVGIAIALVCNPELIIADEPTTALDVTIQAQVLELMKELKVKFNTSMILITHDLGIVAEICDKVAIMYAGNVVECADKRSLYLNPLHPYTNGLFQSIPDIDRDQEELNTIQGLVPDPTNLPTGCPFHPRCPKAMACCIEKEPQYVEVEPGHQVKCFLYSQKEQKQNG